MIDARRLRVLRAFADHATVTAAGAALHLTPSAVSQQLAALEVEAGQQLLRRNGRRVALNAAGRLLLDHADAVLAELERAQASLTSLAEGTGGRVEVASFASAITLVLAPAIETLGRTHPGIDLVVRDAEGHASVPMLLDGEIDIAVTMAYRAAPRSDDRLTRYPLYTEPFDAVLPANHPLAARETITLPELEHDHWVVPLPGNPCREVVELACENSGYVPDIRHTSDDFHAVAALVAVGTGVALVPRTALTGVPDVRVVPVRDAPLRRVFAAVRTGSERHPLIGAVTEALHAAAVSVPSEP
jgi:DNA-binding transcriptional LysR family regulator